MNLIAIFTGILLALASCAPVYAGMSIAPGTPAHTHSDASTGGGTLALSGTLSSSKACATGYTRISANYCARNSVGVADSFVSAGACAQTSALSGVTDAKGVQVLLFANNISAGAVGSRQMALSFYLPTDTTCAAGIFSATDSIYEFSAVAAGTLISTTNRTFNLLSSATGRLYVKPSTFTSGTGASFDLFVLGYFD